MIKFIKVMLKNTFFKPYAERRVFLGPYTGIRFTISKMQDRLSIFYKKYEPEIFDTLGSFVKPGICAIDVGAHYGIHVMYIWKILNNNGSVYAFEPYEENFNILKNNIKINNARNIHPFQNAVSDKKGSMFLSIGSSSGTNKIENGDSSNCKEVSAIKLDDFCSKENIAPELILIDVEGHDLNVLLGATEILEKYRPKLIIEHHNKQNQILTLLKKYYKDIKVEKRHIIVTHNNNIT